MPKQHELLQLQDAITQEVNGDAAAIAEQVFGKTAEQPDMASVPNERLDAIYRRAFQTGDRKFLQAEAQRDPRQFMQVAKRLGVQKAPPASPQGPLPAAPQAPILPAPPAPAPVPLLPGAGAVGVPPVAGPPSLPPSAPAAPLPALPGVI